MEIIGRLTADALVSETKTGKRVVNFTIAQNDFYKPADGSDTVKITTYFKCAYWINTAVAALMAKGALVQAQGRIGIETYLNKEGLPVANITCHVNKINIYSLNVGERTENRPTQKTSTISQNSNTKEPLPF